MNGTWEQSDYYDMRKGVNFYWNWHKVVYTMQLLNLKSNILELIWIRIKGT